MNETELPTPGQVATNEAAKQAVMLVFGVVTAVIVMKLQSKYMKQMMSSVMPGSAASADDARTGRMSEAKRIAGWWQKGATRVGRVYLWMLEQADKAQAAYDRERA